MGKGGRWRVYSRKAEPGWYWAAVTEVALFISLGIFGTFYPHFGDVVLNDFIAPLAFVALLAVCVVAAFGWGGEE